MALRWIVLVALSLPAFAWADSVALVLNGVPGSPEHKERFDGWTEATHSALVDTLGFDQNDVRVLSGAREADIRSAFAELQERVGSDDEFFLFFIGHGSFDGNDYKFNTLGPDLTASDYDELVSSLGAGRSVIIIATNSSGAAIDQLAAPARVVVTATRSGTERNDTTFYNYFLEAITDSASDEDKNERLSVWEAFRYATLAVERFYTEENRLATEHPQISDNGEAKSGVETDTLPTLARTIHFTVEPEIDVADPVLRALLEQRRALESDVEALRLVRDITPPDEYETRMEALLIELALKNQEIRALEEAQ